jgi:hypothetical protein
MRRAVARPAGCMKLSPFIDKMGKIRLGAMKLHHCLKDLHGVRCRVVRHRTNVRVISLAQLIGAKQGFSASVATAV